MAEQPPTGPWYPPPSPAPRPSPGGVGGIVAASVVGVALVGLTWLWQASGWTAEQILLQLDLPC